MNNMRDTQVTRPGYIHLNGELVPWEDGKVHVSTGAFKFGAAVFEGIRGYWSEEHEQMYLFRLDEHMRRLTCSQVFMRFDEVLDTVQIGTQTLELIRANELRENIHVVTTVFVNGMGGPATCGPVGLAITTGPWAGRDRTETGVSVQVSSWQRAADTALPMRVKCNANYQNGRLAAVQAEADGYDTAIMLNSRGKVSEGPAMCFFMVRDGVAITPTVTSDILESITRRTVLEILPRMCATQAVEREIDRSELVMAEEAFFCGTAWEVTPITSVDRMPVGTGQVGPVVKKLQRSYFDLTNGRTDLHPDWLTAVY